MVPLERPEGEHPTGSDIMTRSTLDEVPKYAEEEGEEEDSNTSAKAMAFDSSDLLITVETATATNDGDDDNDHEEHEDEMVSTMMSLVELRRTTQRSASFTNHKPSPVLTSTLTRTHSCPARPRSANTSPYTISDQASSSVRETYDSPLLAVADAGGVASAPPTNAMGTYSSTPTRSSPASEVQETCSFTDAGSAATPSGACGTASGCYGAYHEFHRHSLPVGAGASHLMTTNAAPHHLTHHGLTREQLVARSLRPRGHLRSASVSAPMMGSSYTSGNTSGSFLEVPPTRAGQMPHQFQSTQQPTHSSQYTAHTARPTPPYPFHFPPFYFPGPSHHHSTQQTTPNNPAHWYRPASVAMSSGAARSGGGGQSMSYPRPRSSPTTFEGSFSLPRYAPPTGGPYLMPPPPPPPPPFPMMPPSAMMPSTNPNNPSSHRQGTPNICAFHRHTMMHNPPPPLPFPHFPPFANYKFLAHPQQYYQSSASVPRHSSSHHQHGSNVSPRASPTTVNPPQPSQPVTSSSSRQHHSQHLGVRSHTPSPTPTASTPSHSPSPIPTPSPTPSQRSESGPSAPMNAERLSNDSMMMAVEPEEDSLISSDPLIEHSFSCLSEWEEELASVLSRRSSELEAAVADKDRCIAQLNEQLAQSDETCRQWYRRAMEFEKERERYVQHVQHLCRNLQCELNLDTSNSSAGELNAS